MDAALVKLVGLLTSMLLYQQGEAYTRIMCPKNVTAPANGQISYHRRGYSAVFKCERGYFQYGDRRMRCNIRTGEWKGLDSLGFCIRDENVCPEVHAPVNGYVYASDTSIGSKAHYTCDPGYSRDGVRLRVCNRYLQWTMNTPVCMPEEQFRLKKLVDDLKTNVLANYENKTDGPVAFSWTGDTHGLDIFFLLDGSASLSVKNFNDSVKFIKGILGQFEGMIQGSLRVSVINYSNVAEISVQGVSVEVAKEKLDTLKPKHDSTRTDLAFKQVKRIGHEQGALQMVFVMTDGYEDNIGATIKESSSLEKRGVDIYAIGVGNRVNTDNLKKIVSEPFASHYTHIEDFNLLEDINTFLDNRKRDELCGMSSPEENGVEVNVGHVGGGTEIKRGESPWTVYLKGQGLEVNCSGVVICKRWVLTAAECLYKDGKKLLERNVKVVAGHFDRFIDDDPAAQNVEPARFWVHPSYSPDDATYNIALINLKNELRFDNDTRAICVPQKDDKTVLGQFGDFGKMVGWGDTEISKEFSQSFTPLSATGRIASIIECQKNLATRNMTFNSTTMDCLHGNQAICNGDGGTGLVMDAPQADDAHSRKRAFVIGVASAGDPGLCPGNLQETSTESANLNVFAEWISETTGNCNKRYR